VVLKAKLLGHFLLGSALDDDSSQGFVSPVINVSGLREVPPHRRVVHDLASRKMSVGDRNKRPSDFTRASNPPGDESHEFSTKTGSNATSRSASRKRETIGSGQNQLKPTDKITRDPSKKPKEN
jgi:hypothetical protein